MIRAIVLAAAIAGAAIGAAPGAGAVPHSCDVVNDQSLMAVIKALTDTHEKKTSNDNSCLEQFHADLSSCNMYDYEDTQEYKQCLDAARANYDNCREQWSNS